ncbi:hypothetical protein F5Y14DRAFT_463273 [Nemania sp. NC0429]|nr:hypothetical protein F5Y14DRAFT_463273 [Nemania sp. NC0429]
MKKAYTSTKNDLKDHIKEPHLHEASVGSTAMATLEYGSPSRMLTEPTPNTEEITRTGITRAKARTYSDVIKSFIIGDEGPGLFGAGRGHWRAEDEVLPKLRTWMVENTAPRTLWISSPYDVGKTTSARAAALGVVSAAWQAETPLISHFCQRPQPSQMRAGADIAKAGLVGMLYSLIHQLLQFNSAEEELDISAESLAALDGSIESWGVSLEVLRVLLDRTPDLMYCVIDGFNDLEWGSGEKECRQVLDILFGRQRQEGKVFNILLTTAGQSRILPSYVHFNDRHIATKGAREVARFGRRVEL